MAVISWDDEGKKPKPGTVTYNGGNLQVNLAPKEQPEPLEWNPMQGGGWMYQYSPTQPINGVLAWMNQAPVMGAPEWQPEEYRPMSQQQPKQQSPKKDNSTWGWAGFHGTGYQAPPKAQQPQPQPAAVERPANPLDQHGRGQSGQSRTMANGDVYNYWAKYGQEMTRQGLIRQGVMDGTNYNSNNPLFDLRSSNMEFGRYGVGDLRYKAPTSNTAAAGTGGGGYGRSYGGYGYGGGGSYNYSRPKPKWFMEMLSWRI